jgi:hypothetical protein
MTRIDTAKDKSEVCGELLRGLPAIGAFLGCNVRTVGRFVREGLPVARVGIPLCSTKALVLAWVEKRCKEGVSA